jgi:MFS family permease
MYGATRGASSRNAAEISRLTPAFREQDARRRRHRKRILCRPVSQPSLQRPRLLTRPFVIAATVSVLQSMSFYLFVHFPRFLADMGADEVGIGFVVAAASVASILVRPQVGLAADRRGRRPLILAGGALNVAVIPLYLTVGSLGPWVVAVRLLHGIATALIFTALFTYGADQVPESRRTQGLALFGASTMIPMAVGGWLGDAVLTAGGFRALFLTALGFAAAGLILSAALPEPARQPPAPGQAPGRFLHALTQADLVPVWFISFAFAVVLTGYFTFMRTFVDTTGVGSVGAFFASYAGAALAVRVFGGGLPDRIGRRLVLYPSLGAVAGAFLLLSRAGSVGPVIAAGVLCGVGAGYAFPLMYVLAVDRAAENERGSAIAIFTGLFDLGTLAGSPSLGWVIVHFGYGAMFATAAGLMVASAFAYAVWDGDLPVLRRPAVRRA